MFTCKHLWITAINAAKLAREPPTAHKPEPCNALCCCCSSSQLSTWAPKHKYKQPGKQSPRDPDPEDRLSKYRAYPWEKQQPAAATSAPRWCSQEQYPKHGPTNAVLSTGKKQQGFVYSTNAQKNTFILMSQKKKQQAPQIHCWP